MSLRAVKRGYLGNSSKSINTVIHFGNDYYIYIESDVIAEFIFELVTLLGYDIK